VEGIDLYNLRDFRFEGLLRRAEVRVLSCLVLFHGLRLRSLNQARRLAFGESVAVEEGANLAQL
jgi:hypothetical protein